MIYPLLFADIVVNHNLQAIQKGIIFFQQFKAIKTDNL
ncbi:hypothetical protein CHCC14809_2887 [Bacillus licheniformis]|nr:hypothetical protein CHCC5026_2026 [Bacillus licheniformis]TWM26279.1 hypothetical protein CHCC14821_3904 [Bacillus paralicheniformis]TWK62551.1 hypothetical protein CHCC20343_0667 [Bacillus licheniformis]TWK69925.1 hypothetical protein CHCC20339_2108 [Bacillus licheniformis]TWL20244.1 hypothetical protein CHCC16874_3929 [Bacillus licheniformis]